MQDRAFEESSKVRVPALGCRNAMSLVRPLDRLGMRTYEHAKIAQVSDKTACRNDFHPMDRQCYACVLVFIGVDTDGCADLLGSGTLEQDGRDEARYTTQSSGQFRLHLSPLAVRGFDDAGAHQRRRDLPTMLGADLVRLGREQPLVSVPAVVLDRPDRGKRGHLLIQLVPQTTRASSPLSPITEQMA